MTPINVDVIMGPKVVIAGSESGDKLPLSKKCSQWRATQTASDN